MALVSRKSKKEARTNYFLKRLFYIDIFFSVPFLFQILRQSKDNQTPIRVTGGTYPFTPVAEDVIVDLRYIDRLIGLDIYQQT